MVARIVVRKPTDAEVKTASAWGIWDKEPSVFEWSYSSPETCLILEGEAEVKAKDGSDAARFKAGDWVVFPTGLECVWTVKKAIKKHYRFG